VTPARAGNPGSRRQAAAPASAARIHKLFYAPTCPALHWSRHVHSPQLSSDRRQCLGRPHPDCPRRLLLAQTNSVYRNPILGGDHPDASPIRVANEFFLTHSSFDYAPGLLIWRSADLVNWRPVAAALHRYAGSVWAPYLCEYEGRFYIYFPADNRLRVVHAEHPLGPWSEPIDWASTPSTAPHRREWTPLPLRQRRRDG